MTGNAVKGVSEVCSIGVKFLLSLVAGSDALCTMSGGARAERGRGAWVDRAPECVQLQCPSTYHARARIVYPFQMEHTVPA